ncbi:MAG: SDR family oxidoreductase, partial [Betaproteobacteria bacterium]|nr:SDR family oxidoreductase [Betaproteobacteria bacterium]
LVAALAGQDIAYYLVHCMRAGDAFDEIERQGAQNFANAAARTGVRRIVYLGGLIPRSVDSKHLISRRLTGEILRAGRVPVTELRAGIIVGPGCASFEIIRDLVNHLPVMVTPRWVRSKSPPIALSNVLTYLIEIAHRDEAAGRILDLAGPEELSYEELMRQYGRAVGKRPMILPVPVLSPRLSSYWLRLVTAVPTSTARALIDGLKLHIKAEDSEIRRLVPQRLLTYAEAVAEVFEVERRHAVAARWTEGALMYRDYNPKYAFYAMRDSGSFVARASPERIWAQVAAIGGKNRYYAVNWLWTIRETMDWALGGLGRHRGRRHPTEVRVGDTIDTWRVIGAEPPRRLTLAFGMKAPGAAILEFEVTPVNSEHTRITVTAYWHPAGVWGLLYWYAFVPAHFVVFHGMARAIALRAEGAA